MQNSTRDKQRQLELRLKPHGEVMDNLLQLLELRCEEVRQYLAVAEMEQVPRLQGEHAAYDKLRRSLTRQSLHNQTTE